MGTVEIKGLDNVIKNLNKQIKKIEGDVTKGLLLSAALIRTDMERTPPKIPVDLGNLRASWFVVSSFGSQSASMKPRFKGKRKANLSGEYAAVTESYKGTAIGSRKPMVIMGFSANYAVYVHEMVDAKFKRPDSGAKFFEKALRRNRKNILKLIKDNTQIK